VEVERRRAIVEAKKEAGRTAARAAREAPRIFAAQLTPREQWTHVLASVLALTTTEHRAALLRDFTALTKKYDAQSKYQTGFERVKKLTQ
jgi:hypothetical protein